MMQRRTSVLLFCLLPAVSLLSQTDTIFPGADETTPSRSEYFSWINNTNEGATETQALINLQFFAWLQADYGMTLDIYAFDAGAIDGKRFYGSMTSGRFREQFPNGFAPIYEKAKAIGTRLGVWGGPDGFGDTPESEKERIDQMVGLCRDYDWALFKFDAVCGPLRPEKEDAFIEMMTGAREYCPDLILLNHRLGLERAQQYATTFLWEGRETYIDVFSSNRVTAPHHRAEALDRGLVPGLQRLTEDHGVCISSCPDYWDDDLVLQAFNRCLILAPQVYGNPWLLRDDEFPKFARIFNLHRKYRDILVNGQVLPEKQYGPSAVSRGDGTTRLITLRNLTWEPVAYTIRLDKEVGLTGEGSVELRQFHPVEQLLGVFDYGDTVSVTVPSFRACLLIAATARIDEPAVKGSAYAVIRNVPGKPVLIEVLGLPGTRTRISLPAPERYTEALLDGTPAAGLLQGKEAAVVFGGERLRHPVQQKCADMAVCPVPDDAAALYEATVFAADNNALELRALKRSGKTAIPEVQAARDAFFQQDVFVERGISDRNLFDGNRETGFWPSRKYGISQKVKRGCFRLDFGEETWIDELVIHVPDEYSLQPLLNDEGNYADFSMDLKTWTRVTYLAAKEMHVPVHGSFRYLKLETYPDRIVEIQAFAGGQPLDRTLWRASNLFAGAGDMKPVKAWTAAVTIDQVQPGGYLCIAINGEHGVEGAYAAMKIGERYYGAPDRAAAFQSNTWEYINARRDRNYTYYIPLRTEMAGQRCELYVFAYEEEKSDLNPEIWISGPVPYRRHRLELIRQ
ncbi:hypothetical protein JXO52_03380 [bacterium]|nr:hypothetical protein [bacterium]